MDVKPTMMNRKRIEETLREALRQHLPLLKRLTNGFAAEADRDDLLQEIVIALWHGLPSFRGDAALSTFMYRVALNTALTWRRRLSFAPPLSDDGGELLSSSDPGPLELTGINEQRALLERGISTLPAIDRALQVMHIEGVGYAEISEVLGISVSNVGARLTRIRQRLSHMHQSGELR